MKREEIAEFICKCKQDVMLLSLRPSEQGCIQEFTTEYGDVFFSDGTPKEITLKLILK
jgi:hypothetical protein